MQVKNNLNNIYQIVLHYRTIYNIIYINYIIDNTIIIYYSTYLIKNT